MISKITSIIGLALGIAFIVGLLATVGFLNVRGLAIVFGALMIGYAVYLIGYSEGNKDGKVNKNKYPKNS